MGNTPRPVGTASFARTQPRSVALSVALWTFGLASSLFLVGMWGRTVAIDSATIEESARTVIDSDLATDRINTWFEEGLATAADLDSDTARSVVHAIETRSEYQEAVDSIIGAFVDTLFAEGGDTTSVDLDMALSPLVPIVADELVRRDVRVEVERIEEVLDDAGVVELDAGEAASVAAAVTDARAFLTQVVLVSLFGMLVTGLLAVSLASDHISMVKQLSTRVLVAAASYALILRLAGWALDPSRGRSPIVGGFSVIISSNSHVFLVFGGVAACVAAAVYWFTSRDLDPTPDEQRDVVDDDTREFASV